MPSTISGLLTRRMTEMTAPEIINLVREYGAYRVIVAQARPEFGPEIAELISETDEILSRISAAILTLEEVIELITSDYEADADTKS